MSEQLEAVSVTDFRSIRGTVSIPLGSQVVLLHGVNGAGKSTIMSAIELALTGAISDIDSDDRRHLIHHGASQAAIELNSKTQANRITLSETGEVSGRPFLALADSRFLAERCYLRQRTLGQLLELYENSKSAADSPLTLFVKDLLGLDELEALIEGLDPVGDIRNLRNAVPEYRDAEAELARTKKELTALAAGLAELDEGAKATASDLGNTLERIQAPGTLDASDLERVAAWLATQREDTQLGDFVEARQELVAMRGRLQKVETPRRGHDADAARSAAASAQADAERWRESTGAELEALLNELRAQIPDTPAAAGSDPTTAHAEALRQLKAQITRLSSTVARDTRATTEQARLDAEIVKAEARLSVIDEQFVGSRASTDVEELAKALTALIPFVHDENCPVCGRAFNEVTDEPLAAHLAAQISELGEAAGRLQDLSKARIEALTDLRNLREQREEFARQRLEPEAGIQARVNLTSLEAMQQRLSALSADVQQGGATIRRAVEADRDSRVEEAYDRTSGEIRRDAERIATVLRQAVDPAKPVAALIADLTTSVEELIAAIQVRESLRGAAERLIEELHRVAASRPAHEEAVKVTTTQVEQIQARINMANQRRETLKHVRADAEAARTRLVRRVFNSSLNKLWRDLFVRLSPDEPFVPRFNVPLGPRATAVLETVHRDGELFGAPDVMLSAGNLNTAALTLFLALHLSVEQRLPWLLLDDPVQSMDEIHVTQFAALLRTLAREHARRIIIAVHERPLFEYLALELGPGRESESLVTVELSRSQEGETIAEPIFHTFDQDPVLAIA